MKSSRTIILGVISARYDYHIKKVLSIAQKYDPRYQSVLGIVTQPDVRDSDSDDDYNRELIYFPVRLS